MIMEYVRVLFIGFSIYAIVYCIHAVNIVLAHRYVQLNTLEIIKKEHLELNKLYLHLVNKCEETPRKNITINELRTEIKRLKLKVTVI